MAQNELVFAPLGGVGEIGMNLSIYGFGDERRRQWLIIDCGVSFASEEHLPGVDLILPDIRFLIEERKNIVGFVLRDGAVFHAVGDRERDGMLCRAEHLDGLFCALDGDLIEHHRIRTGDQIRRDNRQQRCKAILVIGQGVAERGFDCRTARSNQQVDMSDFVTVAN